MDYQEYQSALLSALEDAFNNHVIDYYEPEDILLFIRHWSPGAGYCPPSAPSVQDPSEKKWEVW